MDIKIENKIEELGKQLSKELDQIGLYTVGREAAILNVHEEEGTLDDDIKEGRATVILDVTTTIGEIAWSNRVQDPAMDELERSIDNDFSSGDDVIARSIQEEMDEGWDF